MKPSERINQIQEQIILADWVNFGGQTMSREAWIEYIRNNKEKDFGYTLVAILDYLDEVQLTSLKE